MDSKYAGINGNVDQSFISFLTKFSSILDIYAPHKKISKQKLKFRNKPMDNSWPTKINFR